MNTKTKALTRLILSRPHQGSKEITGMYLKLSTFCVLSQAGTP